MLNKLSQNVLDLVYAIARVLGGSARAQEEVSSEQPKPLTALYAQAFAPQSEQLSPDGAVPPGVNIQTVQPYEEYVVVNREDVVIAKLILEYLEKTSVRDEQHARNFYNAVAKYLSNKRPIVRENPKELENVLEELMKVLECYERSKYMTEEEFRDELAIVNREIANYLPNSISR
jgi:uncharacterized protein with von Willebrand factor type A (vWA) domain